MVIGSIPIKRRKRFSVVMKLVYMLDLGSNALLAWTFKSFQLNRMSQSWENSLIGLNVSLSSWRLRVQVSFFSLFFFNSLFHYKFLPFYCTFSLLLALKGSLFIKSSFRIRSLTVEHMTFNHLVVGSNPIVFNRIV